MKTLYSDNRRGCYVELYSGFLTPNAASAAFVEALKAPFAPERFVVRGNEILTRRQTCAFGDPGLVYRYSGVERAAAQWPEFVLPIKAAIEERLSAVRPVTYNYMLSTKYPDGFSSIGFHADKEREIRQDIPICSLSFGGAREFVMRDTVTRERVLKVMLGAGDLLVMRGDCQKYLQHALPERPALGSTRVSWTFRAVIPELGKA